MIENFDRYSIYDFGDEAIVSGLCGRLRALRRSCCMSQTDFATRSGVSVASIKRIESGAVKDLNVVTMIKIMRTAGALEGFADLVPELPESPFMKSPNEGSVRRNCRKTYRRYGK